MKLFKFKRKTNKKFTEENVLKLLETNGKISAAMIQHKFGVGYADAAKMLDAIEKKGYIRHDGQRWISKK